MELLVVKVLSGLVLWILSLCFGLMIPFLLWKSRAGYTGPTHQHEEVRETESLLSDEETQPHYQSTNRQLPTGKTESVKTCFERFRMNIMKYDIASFINCCCGGLFLGICLLELLPESRKAVQAILDDLKIHSSLPVTEFFVALGLLLVMVVEQSVNFMCVRRRVLRKRKYESVAEDTSSNEASISSSQRRNSEQSDDIPSQTKVTIEASTASHDEEDNLATSEATRAIVLITMLSLHSIFEGLALGLETTVANLIQLLIAISVHKSVLAFGLGIKLFETFTPDKVLVAVICSLIFCTGSPLGCAIGVVMTLGTDSSPNWGPGDVTTVASNVPNHVTGTMYATAILECLATGTFLYITFVEVIPMEFSHSKDHHMIEDSKPAAPASRPRKLPIAPFFKLLALVLGFAIITGLQFV